MPASFNGIGTKYYGREYPRIGDGSYVTTEWVTFLWFPIIPLGSWRVVRSEERTGFTGVATSQRAHVVRAPLNWRHVVIGYMFTLPVAASIITWLLFRSA